MLLLLSFCCCSVQLSCMSLLASAEQLVFSSELIDPNSASNNISLCHPPHPHIELCNLPLAFFFGKDFAFMHSLLLHI